MTEPVDIGPPARLAVVVDGALLLQYDREEVLPAHQLAYLDLMDQQMSAGIPDGDGVIPDPDLNQRARFVANTLLQALEADNDELAAATCSYLANRLPDLKQVRITRTGRGPVIDLVFDEVFVNQVDVKFDL